MTRIREEFDADLDRENRPTPYKTDKNRNEVICETCGKPFFIDDEARENVKRAAEHGLGETFVCEECESAYQEAAYN